MFTRKYDAYTGCRNGNFHSNFGTSKTTKLKLIKLFSQKYDYLLLDEPSNHLDEYSRDTLIKELEKYSSYIIVSHDIELLNSSVNKILEIKNSEVKLYHGNYDYWIVKIDLLGALQWQKSYGGTEGDRGSSIQQTLDGGYIIAGNSRSTNTSTRSHSAASRSPKSSPTESFNHPRKRRSRQRIYY